MQSLQINPYPWQIKQWQNLCARWQAQKLPHALLLTGPKNLGKLDFAQAFAAHILPPAETQADLFVLQPEAETDLDKTSNKPIKVEQIRELIESLQQTAQSAQQVVIIEPAEAMNKAASNALLKMLEEPTGQVVFLLISHQPGLLPATIRSRCQKVDFHIPPLATSIAWLKNHLASEQHAELLLSLAENIPLRAVLFAEESRLAAQNNLTTQFIQLCTGNLTPLDIATTCASMHAEQVFEKLYLLIMDLVRLQQSPNSSIAHAHQKPALISIASQVSSQKIFNFLDKLLAAKKPLNAKIHLNMQLLWENLFIEWKIC